MSEEVQRRNEEGLETGGDCHIGMDEGGGRRTGLDSNGAVKAERGVAHSRVSPPEWNIVVPGIIMKQSTSAVWDTPLGPSCSLRWMQEEVHIGRTSSLYSLRGGWGG